MVKHFAAMLVQFLLVARVLAAEPAVLQTGDVLKEDAPSSTEGWVGLYRAGGSFVVLPVALSVEPYHHELVDPETAKDNPAAWSGRIVHATPTDSFSTGDEYDPEPKILVRGAFKPGAVRSTYPLGLAKAGQQNPEPPLSRGLELELGNRSYRLIGKFQEPDCELKLVASAISGGRSSKTVSQIIGRRISPLGGEPLNMPNGNIPLYCMPEVTNPELVWAGDFDGDQNIDLILEYDADSTYTRALFLSSIAGAGQLVKLYGSFTRPSGC